MNIMRSEKEVKEHLASVHSSIKDYGYAAQLLADNLVGQNNDSSKLQQIKELCQMLEKYQNQKAVLEWVLQTDDKKEKRSGSTGASNLQTK
jgi:hypothetical protein